MIQTPHSNPAADTVHVAGQAAAGISAAGAGTMPVSVPAPDVHSAAMTAAGNHAVTAGTMPVTADTVASGSPQAAVSLSDSLPGSDSLAPARYEHVAPIFRDISDMAMNAPGADSLRADSLAGSYPAMRPAGMTSHLREVDSQQMFGSSSVKVSVPRDSSSDGGTMVGDGLLQSLGLFTLFMSLVLVAGYKREIATLSGKLLRGRLWEDYASGRRRDIVPRPFLRMSFIVGLLLLVLLPVKYSNLWLPADMVCAPSWFTATALLFAAVAVAAVAVYESLILLLAGQVTRRRDVTDGLLYLKSVYLAEGAVFISPVMMLSLLSLRGGFNIWGIVLVAECAIMAILFIKETFAFFMGKKIPIFHWFLYLCTVEVFPLSLIWALAVRNQ